MQKTEVRPFMTDSTPLQLTATHNRRATVATLSKVGAVSTVGLLVAMIAVLFFGPAAVDARSCTVKAPSQACLARLPEQLRALPDASVGVWFFAENAADARSPIRYLKAEASWARLLPEGTTSDDLAERYDGRHPSESALQGELRMRKAALPRLWAPRATDAGLRKLALPLGLAAGVVFALTVVWFRQERQWLPLKVVVTDYEVTFGDQRVPIGDVLSVEVAPLRLVSSTGQDVALPPYYELPAGSHERLIQAVQAARSRNHEGFLDDEPTVM